LNVLSSLPFSGIHASRHKEGGRSCVCQCGKSHIYLRRKKTQVIELYVQHGSIYKQQFFKISAHTCGVKHFIIPSSLYWLVSDTSRHHPSRLSLAVESSLDILRPSYPLLEQHKDLKTFELICPRPDSCAIVLWILILFLH
jgi:hypothetical protein